MAANSDTVGELQDVQALANRKLLQARLSRRREGGKSVADSIVRAEGGDGELSHAQQRLWVVNQVSGAHPVYNISFAIRMQDEVKVEVLRGCLNSIVARHETLRTRFVSESGQARAVVDPPQELLLPVEPVASLEEVYGIWRSERQYCFDLSAEPLMRARLLREADDSHVLVVTLHHIVADAWSLGVFFRELVQLYRDFSAGQEVSLKELPIQYRDYAQWQRGWLSGTKLQEQLQYWQGQLSGLPPLLMLPGDRPRPARGSFRGATEAIRISAELRDALKRVGHAHRATLFMTLLGAYAALLGRYAGQSDVAVGAPVANRPRRETEDLIGFFVNTLVMRTDLSGDPSFGELLQRVRHTALQAYAHQDLPFELLVEKLNPDRTLSHNPLFQTMFILQNAPMGAVTLDGVKVSRLDDSTLDGYSRFDLTLSLAENEEGLKGVFEYSTDLFDRETIRRMGEHYVRLLEAAVAAPERRLSALEWLTPQEQQQQRSWNDTAVQRQWSCLHELVREQARRTPAAVAALQGDAQITCEELDRRSDQLARLLVRDGVQVGERVGLCMERSIELLVGMLAVLKAGAAYVPIDPDYPEARIEYLIRDAGIRRVLRADGLLLEVSSARAAEHRCPQIEPSDEGDAAELPSGLSPESTAYVIYTSGSTGVPKGVMGSHRSVVNRLQWMNECYPVQPAEVFCQKTSIGFVDHVAEVFQALTTGTPLVIIPTSSLLSASDLFSTLETNRVTRLTVVPSLLRTLMNTPGRNVCTSLRMLIASGEALVLDDPGALASRFPNATVLNLYGSTEVGADVTCHQLGAQDTAAIPIGRPISNSSLAVVSAEGRLLPAGAVGELLVGGAGLAHAYLNQPRLTAERFAPDPFGRVPGARLFRTGDLARYRADGALDYLGRADHQVKIRGFRIEPGEVDVALRSHPDVADAVTVVRSAPTGDEQLIAYVVARNASHSLLPGELQQHLRHTLPPYMVPAVVEVLAKFPRTPSGKIARNDLPPPRWDTLEREVPEGEYETLLAGLWCEVLGCERVSRRSNFFECGGHSLLLTQLAARIRERFHVDLSLRSLFAHQTLAAQAALLSHARQGGLTDEGAPIRRLAAEVRAQPQPLSFAQQRLWFLHRLMGPNPSYNIPLALSLVGELDVARLEASLNSLVVRHESLRASFVEIGGEARQLLAPHEPVTLAVEQVPDERALAQAVRDENLRSFDLSRERPLRLRLLKVARETGRHVLLLTVHHIVADGWSLGVLLKEMAAGYGARGPEVSPLTASIQYVDFAQWQRAWLSGERLQKQLDYWREKLSGLPPLLELPTDRPRLPEKGYRGGAVKLALGAALTSELNRLSRRHGVSLYMTLLSAYAVLLRRYTRQDDIVVGTPVAGRVRRETEDVIGFFANTLVMRNDLSGDPGFTQLLERTREMALDAYAHQDVPFEQLVDALNPERSLSHGPLVQTTFALQNAPLELPRFDGLTVSPFDAGGDGGTSRFDLGLALVERNGELSGRLEYDSDLFDAGTVERFARHLRRLLEQVVEEPQARISTYELLDEEERHLVTESWSNSRVSCARDRCIHELFEEQAEQCPDAIALVCGEHSVSYRELNRRADQVAGALRWNGVGPDTLVGLCMERSVEMVVGLLGILKAGGAYVPIDPEYPSDRIGYMLEDAAVGWIVTHSRLREVLPVTTQQLLCVDRLPNFDTPAHWRCGVSVTPSHLAYVIYTSGSTGRPKGVMIEHDNIVQLLRASQEHFHFTGEDIWTLFHSIAFDFSVWELWGALIHGGKLVIVAKRVAQSPADFHQLACEQQVTVLNQTPSAFAGFIEADLRSGEALSLRAIVFGGEKLNPAMLRPWVARHGDRDAQLINMYGITETTVHVTFKQLSRAEVEGGAGSLIGRQLPHLKLYVLDSGTLQPAPVGVVGEMYVGGGGVARGYLNQPERTRSRFIGNPFGRDARDLLYRTGDLARWRPDGTLEFIGRSDTQVKIRGFRIELGEIESQLMQAPEVRACAVVSREDEPGQPRLVAYVVLEAGADADRAAQLLRVHLARTLPDYMIPGAYVVLETLPLTPHGKLDSAKLPAPQAAAYARQQYLAPRSALEEHLAGLWQQNLGLPCVGIEDNYFAIGGDSIRSLALTTAARNAGIAFQVKDLFVHPTIASLAAAISGGALASIPTPLPEPLDLLTADEKHALMDQFS